MAVRVLDPLRAHIFVGAAGAPMLAPLEGPMAQNQRNEAQDAPRVRETEVWACGPSVIDGLDAHTLKFSV
jgi:hypothetical protein